MSAENPMRLVSDTLTPKQARRCVLVCEGSSCRRNGSPELKAKLEQALAPDDHVEVRRYLCFGACAVGPNIVVMPDRLWYSFVIPVSVDAVTVAIQQGQEVPGLANHVRPDIRQAVFTSLDREQEKP